MKRTVVLLMALVCSVGSGFPANAETVLSLWGDMDGFGRGILPDQAIASERDAIDNNDDGLSDQWVYGRQAWTHSYDFSALVGPAMYATLKIHAGGLGDNRQLVAVFLDSMLVGYLTSGGESDSGGRSHARLDVLDLSPFLHMLDGTERIMVRPQSNEDGWSLDYALLTVSDQPVLSKSSSGIGN